VVRRVNGLHVAQPLAVDPADVHRHAL
jgi:hypothetical protein